MKPVWLAVSRGIAMLVLVVMPAWAGEKPLATRPYIDPGTEAVLAFYAALLQEEPPTREQELAIFTSRSWLRMKLALSPEDYLPDEGTEPMKRTPEQKENHRRRMEKIDAAGPVTLDYFRKHKERFLPKNMRSPKDLHVAISGTIHMLCSIADPVYASPSPDVGFVEAIFIDDLNVPGEMRRLRIVRFPIYGGRISASEIVLDTFVGESVMERYQDPEPAQR